MSNPDLVLLKRWTEHNDAEAFRQIVDRHAGMVLATCRRILENAADAEEVTQECFLRLAQAKPRVHQSVGGWLHSLAASRSIDRLRADRQRQLREKAYVSQEGQTPVESDWEDIQRYVDESIAELPSEIREPLVRHFLLQETHQTIADDLGLSRSCITRRIADGVESVREKLHRRGLWIGSATLAGLLSSQLAEASPLSPPLAAALGRLAVAGPRVSLGAVALRLPFKPWLGVVGLLLALSLGVLWRVDHFHPAGASNATQENPVVANTAPSSQQLPTDSLRNVESATTSETEGDSAPAESSTEGDTQPTGRISGQVKMRKSSLPVAGAVVTATHGRWSARFITGTDGRFDFTDVPLSAEHKNTAAFGECYVFCTFPQGLVQAERTEPSWINLGPLPKNHAKNVSFIGKPLVQICGRVVDDEANSIEGATVGIAYTDPPMESVTDASGAYSLTNIDSDEVLLIAKTDGYSADQRRLHLKDKDENDIDFVLGPEATVSGLLIDEDGLPVPDMSLGFTPWGGPEKPRFDASTITDSEGRFVVDHLSAGTYLVSAAIPQSIENDRYQRLPEPPIKLEPKQKLTDVILTLPGESRSIEGWVCDENDAPVMDASVHIPDPSGGSTERTDREGRFRFARLPGTSANLLFHHDRFALFPLCDVRVGTRGLKVVLPRRGKVSGIVQDAATGEPLTDFQVERRGLKLTDGEPIQLGSESPPKQSREGLPPGAFLLEGISPGSITLAASAPGYALSCIPDIAVKSGAETSNVVFSLSRGSVVSGTVSVEGGWTFGGRCLVSAVPVGGDAQQEETLAEAECDTTTGTYSLVVPEGDYILMAQVQLGGLDANGLRGLRAQRARIRMVSREDQRVDFRLGGPCTLRGRIVIPADGERYSTFVTVREEWAPEGLDDSKWCEHCWMPHGQLAHGEFGDGVFEFPGFMPGKYRIVALLRHYSPGQPPDDRRFSQVVTLNEGVTTEIVLQP